MRTKLLELDTTGHHIVDLTRDVRAFSAEGGDGLVNVFVPHATAGIAIIELGDGSEPDFEELLERLLPKDRQYNHHHGSLGHGADHLLPSIFSPSLVLPVIGGDVQLGTWQYVVLVDRNDDNPRRNVRLSFVPA